MFNSYVSSINLDGVTSSFGQGLQQLEDDLNAKIKEIEASPNPSQSDLLMLQTVTVKWQGLVQTETGIVKLFGDMMRAVATNIGS